MMKKIFLLLMALAPLATFAGKEKTIDIHITADKNGKVEITGLNNPELKQLAKDINKALKEVTIKIDDGKEKHEVHFKAALTIK